MKMSLTQFEKYENIIIIIIKCFLLNKKLVLQKTLARTKSEKSRQIK
jgi:hypothetical protein